MAYNTLRLEVTGDIATLTLSRPEKRNALSPEMVDELLRALDQVEISSAQILILTGAGKAFCAGMDLDALKALTTQSPAQNLEDSHRMAKMFRRIWSFPKTTIAAVNGAALAGGCSLATLCDFTYAVPEAKFGYTEVRIGFVPAIVSIFLTRQIGEKRTRELLLSGRIVDAAEFCAMGLVTQVVPPEELMAVVLALAKTLLAWSPTSLLKTKKLFYDAAAPEVDREIELAIAENAQIRETADFREGISAFLEKRTPQWTGK